MDLLENIIQFILPKLCLPILAPLYPMLEEVDVCDPVHESVNIPPADKLSVNVIVDA